MGTVKSHCIVLKYCRDSILSLHKILSVAFQIFSNIFRASSHHILDKKNKTEFALV